MTLTDFTGTGVGFGFGIGCGFGVGWGFGGVPLNLMGLGTVKFHQDVSAMLSTFHYFLYPYETDCRLRIEGAGCGIGLGLGWGFGSAFGSQYHNPTVKFQGVEFGNATSGIQRLVEERIKN